MQPGINVEDVKRYNASLREYKDKSAKLRAEIEFSQTELARQCKELSTELGIEVTPENVQDILNERVNKIKNTMAIGNEILSRIKAEESRSTSQIPVPGMAQPSGVMGGAMQTSAVPTSSTQMPGFNPPQPPAGTFGVQAPIPSVTGADGSELPNLPPIFQNT